MKKIFVWFLLLCTIFVFADNRATFQELLEKGQLVEMQAHLKKWEREDKKNAEVYLAWGEYHLAAGGKTGFSSDIYVISEENAAAVIDPRNGKTVGYLDRDYFYDVKVMNTVIEYIDKAISYAPDRYDLYEGKLNLALVIGEYSMAAATLIDILNRSKENGTKWLSADNKTNAPYVQELIFDTLDDLYDTWLRLFSNASADAVRKVAEAQIKLYPDVLSGYNNLGLYYSFNDDPATALGIYLRGEKMVKPDADYYANLGLCYELLDNLPEAIKYYEKVIQTGTERHKEVYRKIIDNLDNKDGQ